jgi:hypothetical protein
MPDDLLSRVKTVAAQRKTTFRALVVDALERTLEERGDSFRLEDASVGTHMGGEPRVSNETINRAIEEQRSQSFHP